MSVPLHRFENDLPFGMQFLADHGRESLLLRVAAQLESETWTAAFGQPAKPGEPLVQHPLL
jgi:Asp-tRNA(Asn)/Glu-tRNA(Gln) amidotransferase A subunit family amidase